VCVYVSGSVCVCVCVSVSVCACICVCLTKILHFRAVLVNAKRILLKMSQNHCYQLASSSSSSSSSSSFFVLRFCSLIPLDPPLLQDVEKYSGAFRTHVGSGDAMTAMQAFALLAHAKLPSYLLRRLWILSDADEYVILCACLTWCLT
jgi:hypothetical protein